ncbi:hypothetical protein OG381_02090 [Streptomyces sp. NBC_00490]|uniref:site-2 protease family protein n=1 Tax=Streptomyces sp. NBC_00490 TaxID=2903657 RepID=UPI002E1971A2
MSVAFPTPIPATPWAYGSVGLLTAVVLLASLPAHELAHAVVARRDGVDVDGITLWMLGGVARLRSEAATPGAELRITTVGPLACAVAGGVCTGLALWLDSLRVSGLVVEAVAWLAAINIVLAVFHSVPAAPLDGGRLLRAFLWHRTGHLTPPGVGGRGPFSVLPAPAPDRPRPRPRGYPRGVRRSSGNGCSRCSRCSH